MATKPISIHKTTTKPGSHVREVCIAADAARKASARLRLACADFGFPLLDHHHVLALIRRLGFGGVDIGVFPQRSHFQPGEYLDNPQRGARELADRVGHHGLEFADIFLQLGSDLREFAENHPDKRQRERSRDIFLRTLELVVSCKARHMTSLPGILWSEESPADSFQRSADELAWRAEQARALGVVYAVEPHMWSVAPTPEAALRLAEASPGLTFTLDYSHFACQGIPDERVHPLIAHASHFHARAGCQGLLQAPLAKNNIDFGAIVRLTRDAGYSGWMGIEYVRMEGVREVPDVDNLSETILLRDLLEQAWDAAS